MNARALPAGVAPVLRIHRLADRLAELVVFVVAIVALVLGVRAFLAPAPLLLDAEGARASDDWTRNLAFALTMATALATIGLTRVRGLRRLLAAALLAGGAGGFAYAAGSLDVVPLWSGLACLALAGPLALVTCDDREASAGHALKALVTGALSVSILACALVALTSLADTTHVLELGMLLDRYPDAAPLALTAVRAAAVAVALLAAWVPFHFGLAELWGQGSAPLAGWLAVVWPWAGWTVFLRLGDGLVPAFGEWGFDTASAVSLFLLLGALVPGAAALAEQRAGRLLALLAIGNLSELLLAVHGAGTDARAVSIGLWGHTLAMVASAAAIAGVRARAGGDRLETLRGGGHRLPRTAFALAVAALLWTGLPGTFTLAARWSLWQSLARAGTSGLGGGAPEAASGAWHALLVIVTVGALLRLVAAARLVGVLYFVRGEETPARPAERAVRIRWVAVFALALALQVALGLGPEAWRARLAVERVLLGG